MYSFYIETYGCTANKADSYIISNLLLNANYNQTTLDKADFILVNTCAVKEQTENKIKERLKNLHELFGQNTQKHIIIAGCLPHITPNYINVIRALVPNFSAIIDLSNIDEIEAILSEIKKGGRNLVLTSEKSIDKSRFLINHKKGKNTGIVPISEGCIGSCAYCCVKNARGKLKCYDPENIVRNVEHQLKQDIKQIYLTSQDCSMYQYKETGLVNLVKMIVNLDYKFFLRIGMINPSFLMNNLDQLITIFNFSKVYQFLHVPIQAGSNKVLKKMQRTYSISDIVDPIETIRQKFPNLSLSTDIICGFPEESEYDFYRTINLIKWLKPEILNISKFTPRPGTVAKNMKQLKSRTIKERSIRLSKIFRNSLFTVNEKWNDWKGEVLILHKGNEENQAFGRNFAYKNVFINNYNDSYGKFVNVKIEKVIGFNLYGTIV